ncbi:hypothetical protein, partial [Pontibacillus marinus]|uniref:hypothetical protein n=1 Tax=Pontibacillus marinus TaxID=273164 RepID=UPI00055D3807
MLADQQKVIQQSGSNVKLADAGWFRCFYGVRRAMFLWEGTVFPRVGDGIARVGDGIARVG